MSGPEARLTSKILEWLRAERPGYWEKIPGSMYKAGIPDILGCYRGDFYAFEVKAAETGYAPTKRQLEHIKRIRQAGGSAVVVYSLQEVQEVIGA